jgi:hypothetical protein
MIDNYTVQHCEHVSRRSFEDVVAALEAELGGVEDVVLAREVAAAIVLDAKLRALAERATGAAA